MVRKVLSLYKAGTRLTKNSFHDEDQKNDESCEDPYESVGKICKYFLEKKLSQIVMGKRKYQTNIGMS